MAAPNRARGFTLVELLVVITILVVLLALLAPAMDQAIYQAELVVCAARLETIAASATLYASSFRQYYPHREWVADNPEQPHFLGATGYVTDHRPRWKGYMPIDGFQDPLTPAIELEATPNYYYIFGSYLLWYSWGYAGQKFSRKVHDRFEYPGTPGSYSLLASDYDEYNLDFEAMLSNHNDRAATMGPQVMENQGLGGTTFGALSLSRWLITGQSRQELDLNFAYQDGAVVRLPALKPNDEERTRMLPQTIRAIDFPRWYTRVPAQ